MVAVDLNLISIIIFYAIVFSLIFVFRKKIEIQNKIFFLFKTKRFNLTLQKIASVKPKFWRVLGLIGVPIGFVGMAFIFGYLGYALLKTMLEPSLPAAVSLVLPGVKIPGSSVFIPFWYGIIALFVVIITHEGMHGVISEAFGVKVKSSGFGLLAVLPIAFVEPDENKLNKSSTKAQLAVFSAGTLGNFITAGLVFLLTFGAAPLANLAVEPNGIYLDSVTPNTPASEAGLKPGLIITELNGIPIHKVEDFVNGMQNISPGQKVTILADGKYYELKTAPNPKNESKAYLGIYFKQNVELREGAKKFGFFGWLPWHFLNLLYWIFTLSLGIGIINLLPLGPIDGGRMFSVASNKLIANEEKAKKLNLFISTMALALLLANIIAPILR